MVQRGRCDLNHPYNGINTKKDSINTKKKKKNQHACSLPSAGDRKNIILGVPRSNHKEWDRFKDNIIKQQFG